MSAGGEVTIREMVVADVAAAGRLSRAAGWNQTTPLAATVTINSGIHCRPYRSAKGANTSGPSEKPRDPAVM